MLTLEFSLRRSRVDKLMKFKRKKNTKNINFRMKYITIPEGEAGLPLSPCLLSGAQCKGWCQIDANPASWSLGTIQTHARPPAAPLGRLHWPQVPCFPCHMALDNTEWIHFELRAAALTSAIAGIQSCLTTVINSKALPQWITEQNTESNSSGGPGATPKILDTLQFWR